MTKGTHEPGPGRSTADAAFNDVKKAIAERNDAVQKEARKLRAAREAAQATARRARDRL
jgi:hypothetical protein